MCNGGGPGPSATHACRLEDLLSVAQSTILSSPYWRQPDANIVLHSRGGFGNGGHGGFGGGGGGGGYGGGFGGGGGGDRMSHLGAGLQRQEWGMFFSVFYRTLIFFPLVFFATSR